MLITIEDAADRFIELIERVEIGEVITITRAGEPVATLKPPALTAAAGWVRTEEDVAAGRMPRVSDEDLVEIIREGRRF